MNKSKPDSPKDDQCEKDMKRAELSKEMRANLEQGKKDFKEALAESRKEMFPDAGLQKSENSPEMQEKSRIAGEKFKKAVSELKPGWWKKNEPNR